MSNFIKTEIIAKVSGFQKNEDGTFQIQSIRLDEKKGLVKNTIKIHKEVSEVDLTALVDKTIKVLKVEEYKKGFKSSYAGQDFKLVRNESNQDIFQVNRELTLKVDNIVAVGKTGEDSKIQSLVKNGTRTDLFEIKLKGIKLNSVQNIKGKEVILKGINISKMEGVGTFYNTTVLPELKV